MWNWRQQDEAKLKEQIRLEEVEYADYFRERHGKRYAEFNNRYQLARLKVNRKNRKLKTNRLYKILNWFK